jgi:hypothetical protein
MYPTTNKNIFVCGYHKKKHKIGAKMQQKKIYRLINFRLFITKKKKKKKFL